MTQMIVAPVARKVGEQVLDGVIDMFLRRNALVVAALWRLPILFRALFGDLRRCKHGMGRQHVEGVRRGGLFAALRIGFGGYVGCTPRITDIRIPPICGSFRRHRG